MDLILRKFLIVIAAGMSVVVSVGILSVTLIIIAPFELGLILSSVLVSAGFVFLLVLLWMKFGEDEDTANMDERYDNRK
jgi:hypothetical protein